MLTNSTAWLEYYDLLAAGYANTPCCRTQTKHITVGLVKLLTNHENVVEFIHTINLREQLVDNCIMDC